MTKCTKIITIIGLKPEKASINLLNPRVCEKCGCTFYFGLTHRKTTEVAKIGPESFGLHKYNCK